MLLKISFIQVYVFLLDEVFLLGGKYELLEENGFSLAINTNNCSSIKERLASAPSDNVMLTSIDMIKNYEYF